MMGATIECHRKGSTLSTATATLHPSVLSILIASSPGSRLELRKIKKGGCRFRPDSSGVSFLGWNRRPVWKVSN